MTCFIFEIDDLDNDSLDERYVSKHRPHFHGDLLDAFTFVSTSNLKLVLGG